MGGWNRILIVGLMLARAVAPASSLAGENPRFSVPDPPNATEETPPIDVWLRRLVGQFEYEGLANPYSNEARTVSGRADCINVGSGPGVQCVLAVEWREQWLIPPGTALPPHPDLNPAMMLFGFQPEGGRVHFLQVNNKGIAKGGSGVLSGNRATLMTDPPRVGSVGVSRIHAPPHGRYIEILVSSKGPQGEGAPFLTFFMRRVPPGETGEASGLPPAQPDTGE